MPPAAIGGMFVFPSNTAPASLNLLASVESSDEIPHHSTFSANRLGRFRESEVLRHVFERVVWAAMARGLVKGEGFAGLRIDEGTVADVDNLWVRAYDGGLWSDWHLVG